MLCLPAFELVRLWFFQTESVEIFFGDARQALVGRDRVAASEGLRDDALEFRPEALPLPAWDLDRLAIAAQGEFGVLVHGLKCCPFIMPQKNKMTYGLRRVKRLATLNR